MLKTLFLILFSLSVYSQSGIDGFSTKHLGVLEGFSQATANGLKFDDEGYLWISTELGIFKYDGLTVVKYNDVYPKLLNQRIRFLSKDYLSNDLYFCTYPLKKTFRIHQGKIKLIEKSSDEQLPWLTDLWCFTNKNSFLKNAILHKKFKNKILTFNSDYSSRKAFYNKTSDFIFKSSNKLYAINEKGVTQKIEVIGLENKVIIPIENKLFLVGKGFNEISKSKIVKSSVSVSPFLLNIFNSNSFRTGKANVFYDLSSKICFLYVNNSIYEVAIKENKLVERFLFKPIDHDIFNMTYDSSNEIYALGSYTNGLTLYFKNELKVKFIENNFKADYFNICYALGELDNGNLYLAKEWIYNPTEDKVLLSEPHLNLKNSNFLINYNKSLYAIFNNKFINVRNGIRNKDINFFPSLPPWNKLNSYTVHNGKYWFSTVNRIGKMEKKTIVEESNLIKKLNLKNNINYISSLNDSILLIATNNGVIKYNTVKGSTSKIKGLNNCYVRYIKKDQLNSFWVGTFGEGLYYVDNTVHRVRDTKFDIATAHALEIDDNDNVWLSTNDGLLFFNRLKSLKEIKKNRPIDSYRYSVEDGLKTNEFNGGCYPSSLKTSDGHIAFPSMKGLVFFDPKKVKQHLVLKKIKIKKISVDGKKINLTNALYKISSKALRVDIEFDFPYFYNRNNLTVEYKIKNRKVWTKLNKNIITIIREESGYNILEIRVRKNENSGQKTIYKRVVLNFQPKFYETIIFKILLGIGILLVIHLGFLVGTLMSKKREYQLNIKIINKTMDLEHNLLELKKSEDLLMKSVHEKELLLKEIHHRVKNNLQLVMSMMNIQARKGNYENINEFLEKSQKRITAILLIHQSIYQGDLVGKIDFKEYIGVLSKTIIQSFEIENRVAIQINSNKKLFNLTTAISLGLIVNELLTNALKHAYPNQRKGVIKISIMPKEDFFQLLFEDDGIGIQELNNSKKSFGLQLVALLATQLEGSLTFSSNNGSHYNILFKEIKE